MVFFRILSSRWTKYSCLLVAMMITALAPLHAAEPVSKSRFRSVAIGGHDAVVYHSLTPNPQAAAEKGEKGFVVKYKGAKWRFVSQASADLFAADPARYAPAYNGHCANALSLGKGLVRT